MGYRPNVFDKSTPNIILSGKWLRAAGFDTGQQVTVKVMKGCIVLVAYNEQEQRLQEEEAKLKRERKIQEAMLDIKKKFGKNAILNGGSYLDGATAKERNKQIGGHKA